MKKLWEITLLRENNEHHLIQLFATNTVSLIQQVSKKHAHLLDESTISIKWKEVFQVQPKSLKRISIPIGFKTFRTSFKKGSYSVKKLKRNANLNKRIYAN